MLRHLVALLAIVSLAACASRPRRVVLDRGIVPCPAGAERDFLSPDALQCWMSAAGGRWRLVDLGFHLEGLVLDVIVTTLDDAEEITRRAAANHAGAYSEILLYARLEPPTPDALVRRVRWVRGSDRLDTLDFQGP